MRFTVDVPGLVISLRAVIGDAGDVVIGVMVGWFPHWHSSDSLTKISHLGLPWHAVGIWFLLCALLITAPATRAVGYGMTSVLYLIAAWSLAEVSLDAPKANAVIVVGGFVLAGVLLCGVATAQVDRGRRDAT